MVIITWPCLKPALYSVKTIKIKKEENKMFNAIYQVSLDPIPSDEYISESDFWDSWFLGRVAEYVDGNVDRNKEIDILKSSLESAGLSFGEDEHGDWLIVNSKEGYFRQAFEKFKEQLEILSNYSLEDFSSACFFDMFALNKYYDDKQSVYISADGELMTLDTFIRRCLVGEKYYIGGVVGYKC